MMSLTTLMKWHASSEMKENETEHEQVREQVSKLIPDESRSNCYLHRKVVCGRA